MKNARVTVIIGRGSDSEVVLTWDPPPARRPMNRPSRRRTPQTPEGQLAWPLAESSGVTGSA